MDNIIPVQVFFTKASTGERCAFNVPDGNGLEILSLMLNRKMDWEIGVNQLVALLPEALPAELLQTFVSSMMAAQKCAELLNNVPQL